jgi:uncharacterized spore protein YtfJ
VELNEAIRQATEQIEKVANVRAAFGEPYEQAGATIIPVAAVMARGCGGGHWGERPVGEAARGPGRGGGLGMRVESRPVGFIRVAGGEACFEPVFDATLLWKRVTLFGGLALLLLLWGFGRRK